MPVLVFNIVLRIKTALFSWLRNKKVAPILGFYLYENSTSRRFKDKPFQELYAVHFTGSPFPA